MGYDAACTLRYRGATIRGTARLEHKDLLFRGPARLTIPLSSIIDASVSDGVLRVRFGGESAEFLIGAPAEKWADRIMHPPSRLDKLGVKAGMRVAFSGMRDGELANEVRARGAQVVPIPRTTGAGIDVLFLGAPDRRALEQLPALKTRLQPAGALWVVRPKGSPLITESETMAAGKKAGLVDVKVVSFSDTHTAEKFVIPVAARQAGGAAKASSRAPAARAPRRSK